MKAEDLFPKLGVPEEEEKRRLTEMQSRIAREPDAVRTALGRELLQIVKNPSADVAQRVLSAFIISGHVNDLNLTNSGFGWSSLVEVLDSEFFVDHKMGFFNRSPDVKKLTAPTFAFLQGLIAALVAINAEKGCKILKKMCKSVKDPHFGALLRDFAQCKCHSK